MAKQAYAARKGNGKGRESDRRPNYKGKGKRKLRKGMASKCPNPKSTNSVEEEISANAVIFNIVQQSDFAVETVSGSSALS